MVGNAFANVMRALHVSPGQTPINREFTHLQFYPLRNNNFGKIAFDLTDDTGKNLNLKTGVTTLTLALREVP